MFLEMYAAAMEGMIKLLIKQTPKTGYYYITELMNNRETRKMDHLACFVPGMLALGAYNAYVAVLHCGGVRWCHLRVRVSIICLCCLQ